MRFKPTRRNIFFPGKSNISGVIRKILTRSSIDFKEMPEENELSGFPNTRPLLVVKGRPYYGINAIKHVATNIIAA